MCLHIILLQERKSEPTKESRKECSSSWLGNIGESTTFVDSDSLVEKYVCSLCGHGELQSVNEARLKIFLQKYKLTDQDNPLERIKGMDAGMLPSSQNVPMQNIARCNYVAHLWKHAHLRDPLENIQPTDHGWK